MCAVGVLFADTEWWAACISCDATRLCSSLAAKTRRSPFSQCGKADDLDATGSQGKVLDVLEGHDHGIAALRLDHTNSESSSFARTQLDVAIFLGRFEPAGGLC
eukprot:263977-Rhodomonas_salina.4